MSIPRRTAVASSRSVIGFGVLGAARIATRVLVAPIRENASARVVAVAARDIERARAFADRQGIEHAVGSYPALLARDDVDVVYNPLPNGLHGPWTRAALEAGKHVLCEKPLSSNGAEARELFDLAERRGLFLMEAIHYAYHPVAAHIRASCCGGTATLGQLESLEAIFTVPIPEDNIRFDLSLAGGATMDLGCYALHVLRMAVGEEPETVTARAEQAPAGIDKAMEAELRFPGGARARMSARMGTGTPFETVFRAHGSAGSLEVTRFQSPMIGHEITWQPKQGSPEVHSLTLRSTFDFQLEAFLAQLALGPPYDPPFGGRRDAVANMDLIDRVYRAAGMEPRPLWQPD